MMTKFFFYLSLILVTLATGFSYFNHQYLSNLLASKALLLEQRDHTILNLEKELKEAQENLTSQSALQESSKKEISDAQEAQRKAAADLVQAQQRLVEGEEKIKQLEAELSAKGSRIQELEASLQLLSSSKEVTKSKTSSHKENRENKDKEKSSKENSIEPVKETLKKENPLKERSASCQAGKVVAFNSTWNFVVINLGAQDGISTGVELSIKRNNELLARAKVTSVENSTAVADLEMDSFSKGILLEAGDQVIITDKGGAK